MVHYRVSPDGAGGNPGAGPDVLVNYIQQVRNAIAGTSLSGAKLGHVDTWQVYVNASNNAVIDALDWIGMKLKTARVDMITNHHCRYGRVPLLPELFREQRW